MPTDLKQGSGEILASIMVDLAGLAAENERLRAALQAIIDAYKATQEHADDQMYYIALDALAH